MMDVIVIGQLHNKLNDQFWYTLQLDENIQEFNLATWLKLVIKFTELNISEFQFLNFGYISYHREISKNIMMRGINI